MYNVYDFPRVVNGEPERDMVILFYPKETDLDQVFHKLGLDYCMNSRNRENIHDDLSFAEFMENITQKMLSPYGITMMRPNDIAVQLDNVAPVISRYELETYQEARNYGYYQARKVGKTAEQIARRLETQRIHGHLAISTWAPNIISVKAITWAEQFVYGNETDLSEFFDKKLHEAKPHSSNKNQTTIDVGAVDDTSKGQYAGQIPQ